MFAQQAIAKKFVENLTEGKLSLAYRCFEKDVQKSLSKSSFEETAQKIGIIKADSTDYVCSTETENVYADFYAFYAAGKKSYIKIVNRGGKIIGFWLPGLVPCASSYQQPNYSNKYQHKDTFITLPSATGNVEICLTKPQGGVYDKIVLIVSGSGNSPIDGSFENIKMYKDLAVGLAQNGIASVRFEKFQRLDKAKINSVTFDDEYIKDINLVLEFLTKQNKEVVLLGHSLGGHAVVQFLSDSIAGAVFMACNNEPLHHAIVRQMEYLMSLDAPERRELNAQELIKLKKESERIDSALNTLPDTAKIFEIPVSYWKSLGSIDLEKLVTQNLSLPMFFMQGSADYNVQIDDFQQWMKWLEGAENVKFMSYANLEHSFTPYPGNMSTPMHTMYPNNVDAQVISDLVGFILGL
ncbi:MAG: alpha/beta hydrolase [Bacteroidia bacterium]